MRGPLAQTTKLEINFWVVARFVVRITLLPKQTPQLVTIDRDLRTHCIAVRHSDSEYWLVQLILAVDLAAPTRGQIGDVAHQSRHMTVTVDRAATSEA